MKNPNKRKSVTLVFDEDKRRQFLGGFHKRKVQRQKKAKEELLKQLKEEKKRIKQDARERYKKLLSNRDVPELEKLLSEREFETENHTVSILEMDIDSLYEKNKCIGINKAVDYNEESEKEEAKETEEKSTAKTSVRGIESKSIESAKDLKRAIKYAALKEVKKSKVFQQKNRLEHNKNRKLNIRKKKKQEKKLKKCDGKFKRKGKR
ncbi:PREDICTED: nucleolar protein 12 [Polistes canadensis]|uniref:nucleolar protein 12 n=1 Tax=Polistes canadensis TaxID=91411 RepID=UPI000718B851|nr:PREDICTED: nucleolar protein 12 [Polistes canadensis]